jgi:hypothetical protein
MTKPMVPRLSGKTNYYRHYRVRWEIDLWAWSPKDAARKARETQLNPDNIATVFNCQSVLKDGKMGKCTQVDLLRK